MASFLALERNRHTESKSICFRLNSGREIALETLHLLQGDRSIEQ